MAERDDGEERTGQNGEEQDEDEQKRREEERVSVVLPFPTKNPAEIAFPPLPASCSSAEG